MKKTACLFLAAAMALPCTAVQTVLNKESSLVQAQTQDIEVKAEIPAAGPYVDVVYHEADPEAAGPVYVETAEETEEEIPKPSLFTNRVNKAAMTVKKPFSKRKRLPIFPCSCSRSKTSPTLP